MAYELFRPCLIRPNGLSPRPARTRAAIIAVAVAAPIFATAALAAFAHARADTQSAGYVGAVQFAPRLGKVRVIQGPPSTIVAKLAERLPHIRNPHVIAAEIPSEAGSSAAGTGSFIDYELPVASLAGQDIAQAMWEGNLLIGAAADEFAARGLLRVAGARATFVTTDGVRERAPSAIGRAVRGQLFAAIPAGFEHDVAANAASLGLTDVHLSRVPVLQEAIVVNATTDTPEATARRLVAADTLNIVFGEPAARFEGVLLRVSDVHGEPVFIAGIAPRAAASTLWVRPEFGIELGHGFAKADSRP